MFAHALDETAELRPLEPWQAAEFAAYVDRDRDHLKPWLPWATTIVDTTTAAAFLQGYADGMAQDGKRIYGIWDAGILVGGTLFRTFATRISVCELGVWLSPDAGGRGLVTKAAQHMIAWAVDVRGMRRIQWQCDPTNLRSRAVAERLGMTREGVQRSLFPSDDGRVDIELWSLLSEEWVTKA